MEPPARHKVLFMLSGSIAAYKACTVISRLAQADCEVQTVASRSALEFVGAATLEGLTGRPVATELFAGGSYMDHIRLIRWADLVVLCPATANTINRLAAGIGDDLISTLFLAHDFDKPFVIAPAMNVAMYRHPATRRSLAQLRSWGVDVLEPGAGMLACGEVGQGRLLEPELILSQLTARLAGLGESRRPPGTSPGTSPGTAPAASPATAPVGPAVEQADRLRILVTSGGTAVPIDGVRSITNTSTGSTGAVIAEHFAELGHLVTLVHAVDAVLPAEVCVTATGDPATIRLVPYTTFCELDLALQHELATCSYDAVIHLAAVSDFDIDHLVVDGRTVAPNPSGKIDSGDTLGIFLRKNHKILARLKDYATAGPVEGQSGQRRCPVVVGFKLTNGASPDERLQAVRRLVNGTDLVVHNDATEIGPDRHQATIYQNGAELLRAGDKAELAGRLASLILERMRRSVATPTDA
jgi:phosphopantothenoylcysteine decarboxylase / phosphopantothenate---cysteine ligase